MLSLAMLPNQLTMYFDAILPVQDRLEDGQEAEKDIRYRSCTEAVEDYDGMPDLISENGSPEISFTDQYDGVPERMYELSETELGEG